MSEEKETVEFEGEKYTVLDKSADGGKLLQKQDHAKGTAPGDYYHNFGARYEIKAAAKDEDYNSLLAKLVRMAGGLKEGFSQREEFLLSEIRLRDKDIAWLQSCNQNVVSRFADERRHHTQLRMEWTAIRNSFWARLKFLVRP